MSDGDVFQRREQMESFQFILTIDDLRRRFREEDRPSWLNITTITVDIKAGQPIDICKLRQVMLDNEPIVLRAGESGPRFTWTSATSRFAKASQVSMRLHDARGGKGKSIKVFKNKEGTVHVTGARDLFECEMIATQVTQNILNHFGLVESPICLPVQYTTPMINGNFSLGYGVDLKKLEAHLMAFDGLFEPNFTPDVYAALKVKFYSTDGDSRRLTASIFGSGKSIIAGARSLKQLSWGYKVIVDAVASAEHALMREHRVEKQEDVFLGHEVNGLCAELRRRGLTSWDEIISKCVI